MSPEDKCSHLLVGALDRPHLVKELEEVGPRAVAGARACEGGPRTGCVQYQRIVPPNIW